jgi:hypothetical protein
MRNNDEPLDIIIEEIYVEKGLNNATTVYNPIVLVVGLVIRPEERAMCIER